MSQHIVASWGVIRNQLPSRRPPGVTWCACVLPRPLLLCVDGLATYARAIRRVFRDPLLRHQRTRPCQLRPWRRLYTTHVIYQYAKRRVVAVPHRIVPGRRAAVRGRGFESFQSL